MQHGNVKFKTSLQERSLILKVVEKAELLFESLGFKVDKDLRLDVEMDITACHLNGCRLNFQALLNTDDFNFAHDILGIRKNLDRETGKLRNNFLPRFTEA